VLFLFLLLPVGLLLTLRGLERYERMLDDPRERRAQAAPPVASPHRVTSPSTMPSGMPAGVHVAMPAPVPPITEPI
jgi:hypothetical protein